MATLSAPRSSSKSRKFSCSFLSIKIEISDTRYDVDSIPAGEFGTKAWRLSKHSGDHSVYDVVRQHDGIVSCSCADYIARHDGNGYGMCKHGRSLVELGLLAAPIAPEHEVSGGSSKEPLEPTLASNVPWWEQSRQCDVCNRTAKGVADRADGVRICRECSAKQSDEAERKAMLTMTACCPAGEPVACLPCQTATTSNPNNIRNTGSTAEVNPTNSRVDRAPIARHDSDTDAPGTDGASLEPAGGVEVPDEEPAYHVVRTPDDEESMGNLHIDDLPEPYDPSPADDEAFTACIIRDHLDHSDRLPLDQAVDRIAGMFRGWSTPFGAMLADTLDALAMRIAMTESSTPAEFAERGEALEAEVRATWEKTGFENGRASVSKPLVDIDSPSARRGRPTTDAAHGQFVSRPVYRG